MRSPSTIRTWAIGAAAATLLLLAASCGSGSDGGGSASAAAAGADVTTTSAADPSTTTTVTGAPRPSAGCGSSHQARVVEEERTLTVDGTPRRYLLTVPSAHDGETPLPVVFDFHGLLEGPEIQSRMSGYSQVAEEQGFVVVHPSGTGNPVQWNLRLDDSNPDLAYFDAVLDQVESGLCVDESRVYATGLSMGAMFTTVLLCTRAEVLAAAVPVAGLLDPEGCDPARPVPIYAFHGTADPIVLFTGGFDLAAIATGPHTGAPTTVAAPPDLDGPGEPAYVAAWAERNGCDPNPTDTQVSDELIDRVYDCPPGADVEFAIEVGGGHAWPGSEFSRGIENVVGYTTFDVDATRDGWAFLDRFTNS